MLERVISSANIIKILRNCHSNVLFAERTQSPNEHNPPHIHAIYNEDVAAINFLTGEVLDGHLPPKALAMVQEWASLHKDTLLEIWNTQEFMKIPPLE